MNETYGRMTGRKRAAILIVGAISGLIVAAMFAPITPRIEPNFQPSVAAPAPQSPIPPATAVHCVVPFIAAWPALAA